MNLEFNPILMHTVRVMSAVLALLLFAANPLVVWGQPCCCCADPDSSDHSCCCSSTASVPSCCRPACCTQERSATRGPQGCDGCRRGPCCCSPVTPSATIPNGTLEIRQAEKQLSDSFAELTHESSAIRLVLRCRGISLAPAKVSGPPLLAIYCVWLK